MARSPYKSPERARAIAAGYRSGFEVRIQEELAKAGAEVQYEPFKFRYLEPARIRHYTPDFVLPNGIVIETKGRLLLTDRQKHKHIQKAAPGLDLRFVFARPEGKINARSKTTYAQWADDHGFQWAAKSVPPEWINEPNSEARWSAISAARG